MKRRAAETYWATASAYTDRFIPTVALLTIPDPPWIPGSVSYVGRGTQVQRSGRVHARLCGADLTTHTDNPH